MHVVQSLFNSAAYAHGVVDEQMRGQHYVRSKEAFLRAFKSAFVSLQILLTVHRLVKRFGDHLHTITWRVIVLILTDVGAALLQATEKHQHWTLLNECLDHMQALYAEHKYDGNAQLLHALVQKVHAQRTDGCLTELIKFQ